LLEHAPHVADKNPPGLWLDREGERVAQAERPDGAVLTPGRGGEGVILGDGAVGVDPQELAQQRVELLRWCPGRQLAHRDVELAVTPEVNRSPLVSGRDRAIRLVLIVALEEDPLAAIDGYVAAGSQAADPMMGKRPGHDGVDVNVRFLGER